MKKTWLTVLISAIIIAAIGFGIQQTLASPSGTPMSIQDASQIVTEKYAGQITEVDLDKEKGKYVYEIELKGAQGEYEVKLDAVSGDILKVKHKQETFPAGNKESAEQQQDFQPVDTNEQASTEGNDGNTPTAPSRISVEEASRIALEKVPGIIKEIELDRDDGLLIYEIEIKTETGEAEIDINAYTGEIVYLSIETKYNQ